MNYETATNDDLEVKLGELLGMGRFAALTAPRYCTNWNATMPLAVEHGVSPLVGNDNYNYATTNAYETYEPHGMNSSDGYFCVRINDKSETLRAIVICLIKVLEGKQ